jgi:hypothetical protein
MKEGQEDAMSWFGIGGIHGLPYKAWDNAYGKTQQKTGYCTHGSNLFPTWHRVYIALFEVRPSLDSLCSFSVTHVLISFTFHSKPFKPTL